MSRGTDQLPPRGKQRPHSFDIGLQERQGHQSTAKSRGVYKFGDGTFMFASTSMAAALDNLQYYPKVLTQTPAVPLEQHHRDYDNSSAFQRAWLLLLRCSTHCVQRACMLQRKHSMTADDHM